MNAAYLGWTEDAEANFAEAFELAQRAVTLDPRYPNAHFALGLVCMWTRRSDRAIAAFEEAIKLNPSFAAAHVQLGQMYLYARAAGGGDPAGGKGHPSQPQRSAHVHLAAGLAGAHYQLRHYAEAVETGRRSWSLNRNWPHGLRYVVAGLAQLGRIEEAQAALAELKRMDAESGLFRRPFATDCAPTPLRSTTFWTDCARPGSNSLQQFRPGVVESASRRDCFASLAMTP